MPYEQLTRFITVKAVPRDITSYRLCAPPYVDARVLTDPRTAASGDAFNIRVTMVSRLSLRRRRGAYLLMSR